MTFPKNKSYNDVVTTTLVNPLTTDFKSLATYNIIPHPLHDSATIIIFIKIKVVPLHAMKLQGTAEI